MIVVTGANGFIGSQVVLHLNGMGVSDLVCVDPVSMHERPEPLKGASYREFLGHRELWNFLNSTAGKKIDWIIHNGAISSTTETSWEKLLEYNVDYSKKIFEWCAQNSKSLIYASSAATYGAGEQGYDDEKSSESLEPLNLYGKSKVEFDRWVLKQSAVPKNWYGLKYFNVYGPNEEHKGEQASVALKAFRQISETGKLKLFKSYRSEFKDGEQKRDFIYVKDVCSWTMELMEKRPKSDIYNMGSGLAKSWLDLAHAAFAAMNIEPSIEFIEMPQNLRDHYQYFTEAKMEKWKKNGLSECRYTLASGVKDYFQNVENTKSS